MVPDANENYQSYQSMVATVSQGMADVGQVCADLPLEEHAKILNEGLKKMQNHVFRVGIMGEFRRGKSTVINALLGQKVVPADILPCTATPNYIRWDAEKRAEVHFKDGTVKNVAVEELDQYVTKITTESEKMAETVENSVIYYPCPFCQNGVEIIDTPGLNDDDRMTAISENIIPALDAIIMVLVHNAPFSQSEADFVRNKVMTSDLGRIIFLVNRMDEVDEEDRPRLMDNIRGRIVTSVMDKIASMYGEDSAEYADAKNKIGNIRLFPISARNALRGRQRGDASLLQGSGMLEFEAALSHLLTDERGLLELITPVNSVCSIAGEAKATILMRREAMKLDQAEFEKVHREAIEKIETSRTSEREKVKELKSKAAHLYVDLLPTVNQIYSNTENALFDYIDNIAFSDEDTRNDSSINAACNNVAAQVNAEMQRTLAEGAEKLTVVIQNRIGDEIVELQSYAQNIGSNLEGIFNTIAPTQSTGALAGTLTDLGVNFLFSNWILGVGGAIAGWKANGISGALVGGGAGALAGYGALMVLGAGLGVVGIPLIAATAVIGTFGGKAAVDLAFRNKLREKRANEARSKLKHNVSDALKEMRAQQVLETWLKDASVSAYDKLAVMLEEQLDATLSGMQTTLTQIKIEMARNESQKDSILKDMDELDAKLDRVCEAMKPVKAKLNAVLNA